MKESLCSFATLDFAFAAMRIFIQNALKRELGPVNSRVAKRAHVGYSVSLVNFSSGFSSFARTIYYLLLTSTSHHPN